MSQIVQSDATGILIARETTPGVQPVASWLQLQPNPGGITNFTRQNVNVERHILSPNMTPERGEVVGYDVSPKYMQDLNKDLLDFFGELLFRSVTKHSGGTGLSKFYPTAVVAGSPSSWTVPSLGALPAGVLVRGNGFTNAANNGVHLLAAGSLAGSIKTADALVAEVPPANATLEVAGVQGTAGDIQMDANGNITSTAVDFTTLGLNAGQMIYVGDPTSGAIYSFATAGYGGMAIIVSVAAHLITLKRRAWTIGAADVGAAKTIRLLFTKWLRNVPITSADYLTAPTGCVEVSEVGAGAAAATDYTYTGGLAIDQFDLDIPVESKVVATLAFIGMTVTDPGAARATGAATALAPLATQIYSTAAKMPDIRLLKQADESNLSAEVNGCKLSFKNNVKPRKQLGTGGAAGLIFGEYVPTASMDVYVLSNDLTRAVNANTDCTLDFLLKNGDGGFGFDFPMLKLRKGDKTYAANSSVMLAADLPANRDPGTGILYSMSQFSYLP
jgi:hypothetical protein